MKEHWKVKSNLLMNNERPRAIKPHNRVINKSYPEARDNNVQKRGVRSHDYPLLIILYRISTSDTLNHINVNIKESLKTLCKLYSDNFSKFINKRFVIYSKFSIEILLQSNQCHRIRKKCYLRNNLYLSWYKIFKILVKFF